MRDFRPRQTARSFPLLRSSIPSASSATKMASLGGPLSCSSAAAHLHPRGLSNSLLLRRTSCRRNSAPSAAMSADSPGESTKLVTFLGKGGSGKTSAAVLAAQVGACVPLARQFGGPLNSIHKRKFISLLLARLLFPSPRQPFN